MVATGAVFILGTSGVTLGSVATQKDLTLFNFALYSEQTARSHPPSQAPQLPDNRRELVTETKAGAEVQEDSHGAGAEAVKSMAGWGAGAGREASLFGEKSQGRSVRS